MMRRVIQTMFYGSLKAKVFVWSVLVMILAAVFCCVLAAVLGSLTFGTGAAALGVAAFITSQSATLEELNRKEKAGRKKQRASTTGGNLSSSKQERREDGNDERKADDKREKARAKARYIASMNEKKMKQLMREHKVRQKHIFLLIDSYPEKQIEQAPAIMWRTDTELQFLVLEGRAIEIHIPLQDVKGILFLRNQPAEPDKEYPSFRYAGFISRLYSPYLPEYHEVNQGGELRYTKNLFQIRPGIAVTNTSVRGVMEVLPRIPFQVDDRVCNSVVFDEYFKELYRDSILCQNMVISLEEYHQRVDRVLTALLEQPPREFVNSVKQMQKYRLITSEHVTKYIQLYQQKSQLKR